MSLIDSPVAHAASSGDKSNMITLEDAKQLPIEDVRKFTMDHLNPGQMHFLKLLGFDKIIVDSAEGPIYRTRDGREVLDFFGGFGSVAFGHNHPRIVAARKRFQDE